MTDTLQFDVRGLPLHVHRWGDAHLPPVLLVHGFLDHGQSFAPIATQLADAWQVWAPDLRGHGRSGWIGAGGYYHFPDYFFDVAQIFARIERPVDLCGHSMGGMIACAMAALFPAQVRSLVLFDGMGPPAGKPENAVPQLGRWLDALQVPGFTGDVAERRAARKPMPDVLAAAARLQQANPRLAPERALHLAETGTEPVAGGVVWRHDPLHRTPSSRPFRIDEAHRIWQAIQAPVLSITAAVSEWRPADLAERHASLESAIAVELPGAGHNMHHEQPDALAAALRGWFTDRQPPRW